LVRARNLLHAKANKHQDNLSRHRQAELADVLGMDMYAMMSDVAEAGLEVHAQYTRTCERLHTTRFRLAKSVWADQGEVRLEGNINPGDASVGVAVATHLGLRVSDIRVSLSGEVNGPAAAYALSEGVPTLLNLDRSGLLAQVLPELDACRTLMPTDPVHQYTVFEHTLRVVRFLDSLQPGTFLGDVRESINDSQPLYLAALLHDVGKIDPSLPHSEVGADLARNVCLRWNLAPGVTDTVEWLVREHLTMARFIRIRDLMNPATIVEFAQVVGTSDRLGLLALLTWADVSAVADGSWTNAQATFLRQLYELTSAQLTGEIGFIHEPAQYRRRLMKQLARQSLDESAVQSFVESLPSYYLTSTPPDLVRLHMHFAERAMAGESTVEIHHRADINATELTVCTLDAPALLSKLLAVIYAYDLSVTGIRACTTMTDRPVALDTLTVSFAGKPVPPSTGSQVSLRIKEVIEQNHDADEILRSRGKDPERHQEIFTHTYVEGSPAILEIRAPRGRGMPYRFSRLIAQQGWNVVSARVGQWAGNATGAFYLQNADGSVPTREEVEWALANA
jgi:[protein-PII] uridylyltransferase